MWPQEDWILIFLMLFKWVFQSMAIHMFIEQVEQLEPIDQDKLLFWWIKNKQIDGIKLMISLLKQHQIVK